MMADVPTMIFGTIIAPVIENFLEMNIAAAAAIIFVLAVRKPARRAFGPHAIYLLWAIVPIAAVATFIPSRTIEMLSLGMTLDEVIALTTPQAATSALEAILPYALAAIWLVGAIATAIALFRRQAAFMRDVDLGLAGGQGHDAAVLRTVRAQVAGQLTGVEVGNRDRALADQVR